ncbi:dipeptidyl peptidase 4-like [Anguilla anguilla]|uniref:dipeptidyl peptidase 4-like n=1 Tax=Anguilla anguilla TaxID=7936 RepID=UPI0015B009D9|nr:dipeptidyl peptidase 4-like [Anguilla anguilla]
MGYGKVLLGIIGAAGVVTLIVVPTVIFLNEQDVGDPMKTYTLDDYFNSTIRYRSYNMRWISDNEYLNRTRNGAVVLHQVDTGIISVFLNSDTLDEVQATDYLVSADRQYVCFQINYTKQWRHSFTASYSMFHREKNLFVESHIPDMVQNLAWAPTGNKLAFVWNFNVYVKPNATAEAMQVTTNGLENAILNGIPDWVYEEEMFSSNNAMWWSPSGRFLAYAEFDDRLVPNIEYSWYGSDQYPQTVIIPYPKAGATNPTVKLFVADTTQAPPQIMQVAVPSSVGASDHYLSSVTWVTDERIAVQWQTRKQNYVLLQIYDFDGSHWNETESHVEESERGWVGRFSPATPVFAEDNISFYKVMSDSNGYKHIHHVNAGVATPITSGTWEVISISKLTKDAIYYISNEHLRRPGQRNLYKIAVGSKPSTPQCLTCTVDEDRCQYNSAYFSKNGSFYCMECYGPGLPLFILYDNRGTLTEIRVIEDNKDLEQILSGIQMPTVQRDTIRIGGLDLWYQMTLPPHFDKSKKYPLLIDVYAGPCSQKVNDVFRLDWATYLASTENVIVASFDGRGSGYQGDAIMHAIYKRLGTFEVEDQISAVRQFINMGFIDKDRIAIWGWSYGGYVTSMALGAGSGVFKCGMAVAPVSKWEYYDSIYTERYMNQPSDNPAYENSTVTGRAANFKSVQYLLVHGTADDNVHFQQAAQISKALVEAEVDFDAMWYTDKDHGLGGSAHHHVYTHMSYFLLKCFGMK